MLMRSAPRCYATLFMRSVIITPCYAADTTLSLMLPRHDADADAIARTLYRRARHARCHVMLLAFSLDMRIAPL